MPNRTQRVEPPVESFGRYALLESLGAEGATEVFRARVDGPEGFEKACALERIQGAFLDDVTAIDVFTGRARLASRVHHPNLVEIYDFGQVDGCPFVAREYVDGITLEAYFDSCHARGTTPDPALALYVTGELCRALAYLQGLTDAEGNPHPVTHGNFAPSSILVGRQGVVKLTNFRTEGTSPCADLAGVAYLCHAILLGRAPSEDESNILAEVPAGLAAVLRRAITGQLDADGLQDGLLDYSFDAGIRVSDRALIEGLREHDGLAEEPVSAPTTRPLGTPKPAEGESTFRVESGAGSQLGVISQANFESMLMSDAIVPTARISVDGGAWQPLKDLPIYTACASPPNAATVPLLSGRLDAEQLPEMGAHIGITRFTGCLRAQRGETLKQFWFVRGVPVYSTSTEERDLLGPCMVRTGLIDAAALTAAQAVMQAEGGLLGEVMLRHRLCSAGALHRGLEAQLRERFHGLVLWPAGHLSLVEGQEPRGEALRMSYDAVQLVTEMVRETYDEELLNQLLQPHLDATLTLVTDGPITHDNLRLNGRELRLLSHITEGLSLRELLQPLAGKSAERTVFLRVVFLLHVSKLLTFVTPTVNRRDGRRRKGPR